jgi:hypothetical protein
VCVLGSIERLRTEDSVLGAQGPMRGVGVVWSFAYPKP